LEEAVVGDADFFALPVTISGNDALQIIKRE